MSTPEARFSGCAAAFAGDAGVTLPGETGRRGFGSSALKVDGSIFAMLVQGQLVVKLPAARVAEMIEQDRGAPFDAGKGKPMKDWVALRSDDVDTWISVAREGLEFVGRRRA